MDRHKRFRIKRAQKLGAPYAELSRRFGVSVDTIRCLFNQRRRTRESLHQKMKRAQRMGVHCEKITPEQWWARIEQFHGKCAYCKKKPKRMTLDHVVPLSRGGQHTIQNSVPCCQSCNSAKGNKTLEELSWK